MRFLSLLISAVLCIGLILAAGCGEKSTPGVFKSEEYGLSFSFPEGWDEVTKDLPERWAIMHNDDVILFTVNTADTKDLMELGKRQAIRDLYSEENSEEVSQEKIDEVDNILKLDSFNDREWYTYALKFSGKNINSIVSGTLCGENEINLVMVSSLDSYEKNMAIYNDMLNSFEC